MTKRYFVIISAVIIAIAVLYAIIHVVDVYRWADTKRFVAKSKEWLKPGVKDIATTVEITHEKNNIYNVNISSSKEVKPFSAVEPDDVIFFSFCVAQYFASKKGFNGWEILKNNKTEGEKLNVTKGTQYSIALTKTAPQTNEYVRNNCGKFIRSKFLSKSIPMERVLEDSTKKPICRRFLEIRTDRDFITRYLHQKYFDNKNPRNNNFKFSLDIDRDGKMDNVSELITGKVGSDKTTLEVKCSGKTEYNLIENGHIMLLAIDGKEYALSYDTVWDDKKRQGISTNKNLYELTCEGAKLVCEKDDLIIR